jgi:hypothetical protein
LRSETGRADVETLDLPNGKVLQNAKSCRWRPGAQSAAQTFTNAYCKVTDEQAVTGPKLPRLSAFET